MRNVYEDQARDFANVPLIRRNVVASVHVEDKEDVAFWNSMLQKVHSGEYNFISHSKSQSQKETSGCEQCLKFRPYLSSRFFICIDSDMRYLLQEPGLSAASYICQTYTYSWENHFCEAASLQQRFREVDALYSSAIHKPLLLLIHCLRNNRAEFSQRMFSSCLPKQCRRDELTHSGKPLTERIKKNFAPYLDTPFARSTDFETEDKYCQQLGVNGQNAYLHIRGHHLFDLVAYIGDLLCRGTALSFKSDILMKELPQPTYWQMARVKEDISSIRKTNGREEQVTRYNNKNT